MMTLVHWKGCAQDSPRCALSSAESRERRDTGSQKLINTDLSLRRALASLASSVPPTPAKVSPGSLRTAFTHSPWAELDSRSAFSPTRADHATTSHSHRCDGVEPANWRDEWAGLLRVLLKGKVQPARTMESTCLQPRAALRAKMSFKRQSWMILLLVFATISAVLTQGKRAESDHMLYFSHL